MLSTNEIKRRRLIIKKRPTTIEGVRTSTRKHSDWCDNFASTATSLPPEDKANYFAKARMYRHLTGDVEYLEARVAANIARNAVDEMEIAISIKHNKH